MDENVRQSSDSLMISLPENLSNSRFHKPSMLEEQAFHNRFSLAPCERHLPVEKRSGVDYKPGHKANDDLISNDMEYLAWRSYQGRYLTAWC